MSLSFSKVLHEHVTEDTPQHQRMYDPDSRGANENHEGGVDRGRPFVRSHVHQVDYFGDSKWREIRRKTRRYQGERNEGYDVPLEAVAFTVGRMHDTIVLLCATASMWRSSAKLLRTCGEFKRSKNAQGDINPTASLRAVPKRQ